MACCVDSRVHAIADDYPGVAAPLLAAGTNTGPGGTGNAVRFSGYEDWKIGADSLIAESRGHFDDAEYQHQLEHGVGAGLQ